MALPTKEEEVILEVFRGNVADVLTKEESKDEMFMLRWLRARDLNLEKAEEMLRNAKKWRLENNLDHPELRPKAKPYYYENFPWWMDGVDKEGRPVVTSPFGKWDVRKVTKDGKSSELFIYFTEVFETVMKGVHDASKAKREKENDIKGELNVPPVTQVIAILDWEGFAWGQLFSYKCVQNFLQIGSIYEAYYPEILYKAVFVNCPSLISTVLGLLKPVLAPKTMAKIVCHGSDRGKWTNELLQYIDEDQLRPRFGGTKEDDSAENN